jgi:hypothetical protein
VEAEDEGWRRGWGWAALVFVLVGAIFEIALGVELCEWDARAGVDGGV